MPLAVTPAVQAADRAGVAYEVLEYIHRADADSYGLEAATALSLPPEIIFKTLIAKIDGRSLAVALVPVNRELDFKALAAVVGGKRAEMAPVAEAERATGYVAGGISPLGQRKRLPTVMDETAAALDRVCVSAGRRGLQIRLRPSDLVALTGATLARLAR
jgi:Cys-tRNA(Pro)/Cys-tRNA(Cys) deacylase